MYNAFFSILPSIAAAFVSVILFLRIERNNILAARNFFWHYAVAFGIISVSGIPVFIMNLGITISYNALYAIYVFTVFTIFISYLLFFRGTVLFFIKDRFFPTILPLLILPVAAALSLVCLHFLKFPSIIVYTAFAWGFLFVNNNLLGSIFIYSFAIGSPIKNIKRKSGGFILGLSWFFILGLDVFLWISAASYHPEFWILRITSLKAWFLLRAVAYLMILAGLLLSAKYLRIPNIEEKEN